ncbi:BamA/TamA family outer membrane protein [Cesiribacter andamanensis]|uniref:BamA/TamA family outer membrane protein n=1 Tax=Cesiribacter andamanensis TaxID=649507 RepID=UPI00034B9414|nr:BamA/TamA family outer membrane protein [Cesiribacter andamanensis]
MLLLTLNLSARGQGPAAPADTSAQQAQKGSWIVLPVVYYSPETRFGFGALGMHLFKFRGADSLTRTSNVQAYALYTLNKQLLISPKYTLFTNGERYMLSGNLAYFKFPQLYYGIGNDLPQENEELVDYSYFRAENKFLKKLTPSIFGGIQWNLYSMFGVDSDPEGVLAQTQPLGWRGYRTSGLGLVVAYDTRDIVVNPTAGAFLELTSTHNSKALGSQFVYSRYSLDARKYVRLNKKGHILALQAIGQFTRGSVPFMEVPALGNEIIMRGYYEGRYRDKQYVAAQAEYRLPLFWRIGAVGFAGLGDVAPSLGDFTLASLKPSYGLGARFMVNKAERVNIRVDYGWGKGGSSGFYLEITEAF